ncbi:MAG: metallophosphoesterase, partial [Candidatus Omnitrophica bacterium]|nr:metallophosphoesterase [Candidatus Omnitrophota bacterium]
MRSFFGARRLSKAESRSPEKTQEEGSKLELEIETQKDFGIAGDGQGGASRKEHEEYQKNIPAVLAQIAEDLDREFEKQGDKYRVKFDEKTGEYGIRDAVERLGGSIGTEYGEVRIESGVLIMIDTRFDVDHAGRGRLQVFARTEARARHELTELEGWIAFAAGLGLKDKHGVLITEERIRDTKDAEAALGDILIGYMNRNEENYNEVMRKDFALHKQALVEEAGMLEAQGKIKEAEEKRLEAGAVLPGFGAFQKGVLHDFFIASAGREASDLERLEKQKALAEQELKEAQAELAEAERKAEAIYMKLGNAGAGWKRRDVEAVQNVVLDEAVDQRHVVIGDIHGNFEGLILDLRDAGLIDTENNWIGGDAVLVQMGDVIDRDPRGREADVLLRKLQEQARKEGGNVVRLLGNHELMFMQGIMGDTDMLGVWFYSGGDKLMQELRDRGEDPDAFLRDLHSDIRAGDIVAAYTVGGRIFVHGGVTEHISAGRTVEEVKDDLNQRLKHALEKGDLSEVEYNENGEIVEGDEIFNMGKTRGGPGLPGIFWTDYNDLLMNEKELELKQVVGHTPEEEKKEEESEVRISPGKKLINVDIGHAREYGGNRGYFEMGGKDEQRRKGNAYTLRRNITPEEMGVIEEEHKKARKDLKEAGDEFKRAVAVSAAVAAEAKAAEEKAEKAAEAKRAEEKAEKEAAEEAAVAGEKLRQGAVPGLKEFLDKLDVEKQGIKTMPQLIRYILQNATRANGFTEKDVVALVLSASGRETAVKEIWEGISRVAEQGPLKGLLKGLSSDELDKIKTVAGLIDLLKDRAAAAGYGQGQVTPLVLAVAMRGALKAHPAHAPPVAGEAGIDEILKEKGTDNANKISQLVSIATKSEDPEERKAARTALGNLLQGKFSIGVARVDALLSDETQRYWIQEIYDSIDRGSKDAADIEALQILDAIMESCFFEGQISPLFEAALEITRKNISHAAGQAKEDIKGLRQQVNNLLKKGDSLENPIVLKELARETRKLKEKIAEKTRIFEGMNRRQLRLRGYSGLRRDNEYELKNEHGLIEDVLDRLGAGEAVCCDRLDSLCMDFTGAIKWKDVEFEEGRDHAIVPLKDADGNEKQVRVSREEREENSRQITDHSRDIERELYQLAGLVAGKVKASRKIWQRLRNVFRYGKMKEDAEDIKTILREWHGFLSDTGERAMSGPALGKFKKDMERLENSIERFNFTTGDRIVADFVDSSKGLLGKADSIGLAKKVSQFISWSCFKVRGVVDPLAEPDVVEQVKAQEITRVKSAVNDEFGGLLDRFFKDMKLDAGKSGLLKDAGDLVEKLSEEIKGANSLGRTTNLMAELKENILAIAYGKSRALMKNLINDKEGAGAKVDKKMVGRILTGLGITGTDLEQAQIHVLEKDGNTDRLDRLTEYITRAMTSGVISADNLGKYFGKSAPRVVKNLVADINAGMVLGEKIREHIKE